MTEEILIRIAQALEVIGMYLLLIGCAVSVLVGMKYIDGKNK